MEGLSGMKVTWHSARTSITWDWLSSYFLPLVIIQWTHLNTTSTVPDLDRNNLIQTTHACHTWHSRPRVPICFTSITYPYLLPLLICPGVSFNTTCGRELWQAELSLCKECAFYFSWLEFCLSHQTMPNHVKGHKNEVSELWIKILNLSLKSSTVLQGNKCTCISKRPYGFSGGLETQML